MILFYPAVVVLISSGLAILIPSIVRISQRGINLDIGTVSIIMNGFRRNSLEAPLTHTLRLHILNWRCTMNILSLLSIFILTFSESQNLSFQTDWSGGPGVPGPEYVWGDCFNTSEGINYWGLSDEENLELSQYSIATAVDTDFFNGASICSDDMDNDGDIDLVATSGDTGTIHWWENVSGNGLVWDEHSITENFPGCFAVYVADVDGDGFMDVTSATRVADELAWWQNPGMPGGNWAKHIITTDFTDAYLIQLVDIDGDNDLDAVGSALGQQIVYWFENTDGTGQSWSEHLAYDLGAIIRSFDAVDMDGDGDIDITTSGGPVLYWLNNIDGTGSTWSREPIISLHGIEDIVHFDMDNDGDVDLLASREYGDSNEFCLENTNGLGTEWIQHDLYNSETGSRRICTADIYQNGFDDAVTVSEDNGIVKVWGNTNGTGTEWSQVIVDGNFPGAADVTCADFNGDNTPDIAAVSSNGTIAWWQHTAFPESGWLESTIDANLAEIEYTYFYVDAVVPQGTSITYYLRASDDWNNMGDWLGPLVPPINITGMLAGTQYIQYKVVLTTADPQVTPQLNRLNVNWYLVGIEENPEEFALFGPTMNPSSGNCSVGFSLPCVAEVQFSVFDLSGRKCFELQPLEYPAGINHLKLSDLPPGIYVLQMSAEDFTDSCRIVRIN